MGRAEHSNHLAVTEDLDHGVAILDGFHLIQAMRNEVAEA